MTEQPPRGSLPNTKAVRLQAHSLAAPGSRSSSGVPVAARDGPTPSRPVCLTGQSRRLLHLLQTEPGASLTCLPSPFSQVSRSPASTPARGCDCGFFFFFLLPKQVIVSVVTAGRRHTPQFLKHFHLVANDAEQSSEADYSAMTRKSQSPPDETADR